MKEFTKKIICAAIVTVVAFSYPLFVNAARTQSSWLYDSSGYIFPAQNPTNILISGVNRYLNFGTFSGSSGYGFRDNSGIIEFKNSGGSWVGIGSGGGSSSSSWATTTSQVSGQLVNYSLNNTDIVSVGGNSTTTAPFWFNPNNYTANFNGIIQQASTTATSTFAGQSFHGTLYTPNPDRVIVFPYGIATTSSNNNWGANSGETSKEFITTVHQSRIRQNGTLERIGLNNVNKTGLTGFYVRVWRRNEIGTFDIIGTSENIVSSITAGGLSTTTLASPITGVREGDYIGYRMEWSGGASVNNFSASTTASQGGTLSIANTKPPSLAYNWAGATYSDKQYLVLEGYMQAPVFVSISDSIFAGHGGTTINNINYPDHYSFIETTDLTFLRGAPGTLLANRTGWSYQNMGIGGIGSDDAVRRFTPDVINLKPKFVIIEVGSNSITGNSAATVMADWQTMIDAATANNIKVVAILVPPRIALSNSTMTKRDQLNALITTAVKAVNGVVVNVDPYVGKFRSGGDPGNLWDQRDDYRESFNGTSHFNMFGYDRFADAVIDALNGRVTVKGTVDASGVTVGGSVTFAPNTPHSIEVPRANVLNTSGFPLDLTIQAGGVMASSTDSAGGNIVLKSGIGTGLGTSTEFQIYGSQASSTSGVVDNALYKMLSVSPAGMYVNNNINVLGIATNIEMGQCFTSVPSYNNDCSVWQAKTTGSQNRVNTIIGPKYTGDPAPTPGIWIDGGSGQTGWVSVGTSTSLYPFGVNLANSTTNTVTLVAGVSLNTSGTVANGFGAGVAFKLQRSARDLAAAGYFASRWQAVGSETSCIDFAPENGGSGSGTVRASFCGGGQTGIGTTSPGVVGLNVEGQSLLGNWAQAGYFVATTSVASILPYASSTSHTVTGLSYLNGGILSLASSTLNNFTFLNATGTNATTTAFFTTTASSTKTFVGGNLLVATSTTVSGTPFVVSGSGTNIARLETVTTSGARDAIWQLYVGTSGSADPHGQIQFIGKTAAGAQIIEASIVANGGATGNGSTGNLVFNTAKAGIVTESARFTNLGFGIGTTSPASGYSISAASGLYLGGTLFSTSTVFMKGLTAAAGTPGSICYNTSTLEITANNALTCTVSDEDQKTPLIPLNFSALDMVSKMSPSSFEYKDNLNRTRYGFGAQSLQKIDPRLGDAYDKKGIARSIDLPALIAVNTKAIQELNNKIAVGNSSTNQTEENWQWFVIVLLVVGGVYQQVQIYKLKRH